MRRNNNRAEYGYLAICSHSLTDLSILDFSVYGLHFVSIQNSNAEKYLKPLFSEDVGRDWEWFKDPEGNGYKTVHNEYYQLLAPINPKEPPKESAYFEIMQCLMVIAPSYFHIEYLFEYSVLDSGYITISSMTKPHGPVLIHFDDPYYDYLNIPAGRINDVNDFIKHFQTSLTHLNYVHQLMNYYLSSFYSNDPEMSFISMLICLEGLAPGNEQVSYTLRRNVAVLCGKDEKSGMLIFQNMKKLYNFRSKLVHCAIGSKDWKHFGMYHDYARTIASQCLLELFGHQFNSIDECIERLNITGIGQREKLSENHVSSETCSKLPLLTELS